MNVRFILVRPRDPNNIAAAARALANFGFDDLRVVDPFAPVWKEARAAVGAESILHAAGAGTLDETLKGCHLILGTTALKTRKPKQPVVALPALRDFLGERLPLKARLGILFGSEKTGLANKDLDRCHALLHVPTRPEQPSMNLAQAVVVTAYELRRAPAAAMAAGEPPTAEQMDDLVAKAAEALDRLGYRQGRPQGELRRMFLRWRLSRRDCAFLQGLFSRVRKVP